MAAFLKTSTFALGALLAGGAAAQPIEVGPPPAVEVGRYQAIRMNDNIVLVIDTATGECWSRGLSPATDWRSEGSPVPAVRRSRAIVAPRDVDRPVPVLDLVDDETAEITVRQRGRIEIPHSNGTLFVHIGDITDGQTLVSLRDAFGDAIVRERSLQEGESLRFEIDGRAFQLKATKLRNVLAGDDFGEFELHAEKPVPVEPRR